MVKHGHPDLKTVVVSSDAMVNSTETTNGIADKKLVAKATNGSTDKTLASDQTTVGSCQPEREGHSPTKGNVHFMILGMVYRNMKTF